MKIEVFEAGCEKCRLLEGNVRNVVKEAVQ